MAVNFEIEENEAVSFDASAPVGNTHVDQTYDPQSRYAQSGTAVAEAIAQSEEATGKSIEAVNDVIKTKADKTEVDSAITAINESLGLKADAETVAALSDRVDSKADKNTVDVISARLDADEKTLDAKAESADLSALKETVAAKADKATLDKAVLDSKEDLSEAVADIDGKITLKADQTSLDDVTAKLTALVGEDTAKTVRQIANEEMVRQLITDDADEKLDTIKEIAEWIQEHPKDAAKMASDIKALAERIASAETTINAQGKSVSDLLTRMAAGEASITDIMTRLASVETRMSDVEEAVGTKAEQTAVDDLAITVAGKADASDVQALSDKIDGIETPTVDQTYNPESANAASGKAIAEAIGNVDMSGITKDINSVKESVDINSKAIASNDEGITALDKRVSANEVGIKDVKDSVATKAEATDVSALSDRVTTAEGEINEIQTDAQATKLDVEALTSKITTLIGQNEGKSVEQIAILALTKALIPEDASASMDTLEEIAAWIQEHPEDAAEIAKRLSALESALGTLPDGYADVVTYIQSLVSAETTRAKEAESAISKDVSAIKADYLKTADKTALETKITANADAIENARTDLSALEDKVNGKADKATTLAGYGITDGLKASDVVSTYSETGTAPVNGKAVSEAVAGKADQTTVDALGKSVEANADAITLKADKTTLEATDKAVSALQTKEENDISAVNTKITTLVGDDSGKSARTIAAEELAKELIPENAQDAMNTIAKLATWLQEHPEDVAEINAKIKELQTKADANETVINSAVKNLTISGTTITVTFVDGSTKTLTTQDTNTTYANATSTAAGLMSAADKAKLDGVATGATKITVDTVLSATSTNPVTNKAIVGGGATILNALGTGTSPSDGTYVIWTGSESATAGRVKLSYIWTWIASKLSSVMGITKDTFDAKADKVGTVKSIAISGTKVTVTNGDGTTSELTTQDTNTTYSAATTSAAGLMSAEDKTKLNSIATGANKITVDSSLNASSTNPVQNKAVLNGGSAILNALGTGTTTPIDADYYISQYVGGGATTTTYLRRPMSSLWAYVQSKIESVLGITKAKFDAKAAKTDTVKSLSISGRTITVTKGDGTSSTLTTQDTNTTYSAATTSAAGLMSASDKKKLDGIASGANNVDVSALQDGFAPITQKHTVTVSSDGNTLTEKLADGSTKVTTFASDMTSATEVLTVGSKVTKTKYTFGSDGSVTEEIV